LEVYVLGTSERSMTARVAMATVFMALMLWVANVAGVP
jgi:hypothetical protein